MTTVVPLPGSNGPIETSVDAKPGTSTKRATLPFDEVLDHASEEPVTRANPRNSTTVAEEAIEDAASEDEPDNSEPSDSEPEPDAVVLSSCLAAWQILPLPQDPAPVTANPSPDGESIETISSAPPELEPAPKSEVGAASTSPQPSEDEATALPQEAKAEPSQLPDSKLAEPTPQTGADTAPATPAQIARLPHPASNDETGKFEAVHTLEIQAQTPREKVDGTTVAKEHRAMSETTFHNPAKIAPAAFAEGETLSAGNPDPAPQAATAAPSLELAGSSDSQGGATDSRHEHSSHESFAQAFGAELNKFESEAAPVEVRTPASDTAQVIQTIERAIEKMRTQGSQRMELRLPMRDGEEVIVKLRVEQGEVKATFQSDSEGLRKALETGWAQVSQTSAERSAKAASTVVESSSLPNGSGSFQHSSGQQDRRGGERNFETSFTLPLSGPETRKANIPTAPATPRTSSANLALYA